MAQHLKPAQYAERIGVGVDMIYSWISSGDLRAVNVVGGRRPTWRIPLEATRDFERARTNAPQPAPTNRRSRRSTDGIREFV